MGIDELLDDKTPSRPRDRDTPNLRPRSPISVKELTAILILGGLVWAAYDRLNHFAEKTTVEKIIETQWQQRLETQHNFDEMRADLKTIKEQLQKPLIDPKRKP